VLPTLWAKDSGGKSRGQGSIERGGGKSTLQAVRELLPTLTTSDAKRALTAFPESNREGSPSLKATIGAALDSPGGGLSLTWCEWFMGFPRNWTAPGAEHDDLPLFAQRTT